jgi:PAS domain-containing protein
MREFDRIKVERLRASQQKLSAIADIVDKGILFVSNDGKISFANKAFSGAFDTGGKTVVGLPLNRVVESEEIGRALDELRKKPKDRTLTDIRIRFGDSGYKARVDMVPIISPDVDLLETMIVFDSLQKKRL